MIAYKGFNQNIVSVMGNGKKECCTFEIGKTYIETECKTVRNGFHCCENPFECLSYYSMDGKNRFFKVEAAGNIDEDESERIACTEITLLEELKPLQLAAEGMKYMVEHPDRARWQQNRGTVVVNPDEATAINNGIAIARGRNPRVRGPEGSILGLIVEDEEGIVACKLFVQSNDGAGKWCRLTTDRKVEVIEG